MTARHGWGAKAASPMIGRKAILNDGD